jgi:nitroreductase
MNKEAKTTYEIHQLLKKRWSPRAFSKQKVEKDTILSLLEATRWSPSSRNEQPWCFFVGIKNDETYRKIFQSLLKGNQVWAHSAPVLMLSVYKKKFEYENKPNGVALYDLGQSVAHFTFQATQESLSVHQMGGINLQEAKKLFHIPSDYEPVTAIAVGYIGNYRVLPEDLQQQELSERSRKKLSDFVFEGYFGLSSSLLSP